MTTEAGKHWAESPDWWLIEGEREQARECIAAIEAEAVAAERERIAEGVGRLIAEVANPQLLRLAFTWSPGLSPRTTAWNDALRAVLAIVNPKRPPSCEQHPEDY